MADPLVLYSVNTLLAYRINEHFYGQLHYVWCSPFFSTASVSALDVQMPPSSTPCDICQRYLGDIDRQDWHSASLRDNRAGLKKGLRAKLSEEAISREQYRELGRTVDRALLEDFRPLVYVIPFEGVRDLAKLVRSDQKAHPFSREYVIERLPRSRFDVLDWRWR